ncbi:MAG: dephospho-CoA kinase [Dehalococcoidia bacterium]|nr:dephospho-CoA kinase [Dehalococcoidia bacterium]
MLVVGLTGGIASGKSTVSNMLSELGAGIIDADKVGHEILKPGTDAWRELLKVFGEDIVGRDGGIDRAALGNKVFGRPEALQHLNSITHPRIRRLVEERIRSLREQGKQVAVIEATLLLEAGWADLVDEVWVTISSENNVLGRLGKKRGIDQEQARARLDSQRPISERRKGADVIIENEGDIEALQKRVKELWNSRIRPRL